MIEPRSPETVLAEASAVALTHGVGLTESQILGVLQLPDQFVPQLLELAHDVRMRWCGPNVEVEGIVSLKTGGCPEDCHFCSQSARFPTDVNRERLNIEQLVRAADETAAAGATEFCVVAAVRAPDARLMEQMRQGVAAIKSTVDIQVHASLGILTAQQADELFEMGIERYNHNLETARSFFPEVVTTHTWEERRHTLRVVADSGMQVCTGGILGLGESTQQRAEFAAELAQANPREVPINFFDPRPGTPMQHRPILTSTDALRSIAAFRLAMPRTSIRYAGGREITLGDLGAQEGLLGGVNAIMIGNYLTTMGRAPTEDLDLLKELEMPIANLTGIL